MSILLTKRKGKKAPCFKCPEPAQILLCPTEYEREGKGRKEERKKGGREGRQTGRKEGRVSI